MVLSESAPAFIYGAMLPINVRDALACASAFAARSLSPGVSRWQSASSPKENRTFLAKPRGRLYPLAAGLLEPVPLERADVAEEFVVCLAILLGLVLG